MIQVRLLKAGEHVVDLVRNGVHMVPSEDGNWLYIYDDDGMTVGCYPKDAVIGVSVKGGETTMER